MKTLFKVFLFAFSLIFITVYPLCGENICSQNSFENIDDNSQIEVKRVSKITITKEDGITVATYLYDNEGRLSRISINKNGNKYYIGYNYDQIGIIQVQYSDNLTILSESTYILDSKDRIVRKYENGETFFDIEYNSDGFVNSISWNDFSKTFTFSNGILSQITSTGLDVVSQQSLEGWFKNKYPNNKINIDLNQTTFLSDFDVDIPTLVNIGRFGDYLVEKRHDASRRIGIIPMRSVSHTNNPDHTETAIAEYVEPINGNMTADVRYEFDNDGCPIKIISEISYQKYTQEIIYGAGDMIDGKEGMYEIVKISESDPVKVGTVTYTTTTEIEYLQ